MNKICFVLDCHYPNYTKRLKTTSLKQYIDLSLHEEGIGFIITTNRPNDFSEYKDLGILVYDIDELRKNYKISLSHEILPENPTGIYPSKFPWNLERFGLNIAANLGYNIVINLDSDVLFNRNFEKGEFSLYMNYIFEKDVVKTNQAIFTYEKNSSNEIFHLHNKYIEHLNLSFEDFEYNSLDGPVIIYMGENNKRLNDFFDIWNKLSDFGYEKKFGYGYEGIVCGNWSLSIPMSGFRLKWSELPFVPHHHYEDRY